MDVQRTSPSATVQQLVVTIEPERVDTVFAATSRKLLKNARVPGFRPGRAPRAMLERAMANQIAQDVREQLLQGTVVEVMTQAEVNPIAPPQLVSVGQIARGAMFTYTLSCQVLPKIVLRKTQGLSAQSKSSSVDAAAVEARLAARRDQAASIEPVVGRDQVAVGDWVTLSYSAQKDGVPVPELAGHDATLDTSDAEILPELVQALIGCKVPGACQVTLTLPESFHHKHLAGQQVTMDAQLSELKARVLPELDDAFALDLGHSSLDGLRAALREELEGTAHREAKDHVQQSLLSDLVAQNPIEVPGALVDQEVDESFKSAQARFRQLTGRPMQRDAAQDEALKARLRDSAERRIKASLLLLEVARQEKLTVQAARRQAAIDQRVADAGDDQQRVRAYFDDPEHLSSLDNSLLQDLAVEHLMARADITPAPAEAEVVEA